MTLHTLFNVPKKAQIHQRIPIASIVEAHGLTNKDETFLKGRIQSMYLDGLFSEESLFISAYKDEIMVYEEIDLITVNLKNAKNLKELESKLHMYFPNPSILMFHQSNEVFLSIAQKRSSQNNASLSVVENTITIKLNDFNDDHSLIHSLKIEFNDFRSIKHLFDYYLSILLQGFWSDYITLTPKTITNWEMVFSIHKDLIKLLGDLESLRSKQDSALSLKDKMQYHLEINHLNKTFELTMNKFKESMTYEG